MLAFRQRLLVFSGGLRVAGKVEFTVELTTPACPVKEMFQRQSTQAVKVCMYTKMIVCVV